MAYLRDRAEYENLYDHIVIEWCRQLEASFLDQQKQNSNHSHWLAIYIQKAKYAERRVKCIAKWMEKDNEKDEFEKNTPAPAHHCHQCKISMTFLSKYLEDWNGKGKYRMLFFYKCPRCKQKRGIYDNGEEDEDLVLKCGECASHNVESSAKKKKNWDFLIQETCRDCHNIKKYIWNTHKKEVHDPHYEKDKERFCMSPEELSQLKYFITNAETVLARRKERNAENERTPTATNSTMYYSDPLVSRYYERI